MARLASRNIISTRFCGNSGYPNNKPGSVLGAHCTSELEPATIADLLSRGVARRCIIAHEHRRIDMFDVEAIVTDRQASSWEADDACLTIFLAAAAEHGLLVTPLAFERGRRVLRAPDVVEMTTDLSIIEVALAR